MFGIKEKKNKTIAVAAEIDTITLAIECIEEEFPVLKGQRKCGGYEK